MLDLNTYYKMTVVKAGIGINTDRTMKQKINLRNRTYTYDHLILNNTRAIQ